MDKKCCIDCKSQHLCKYTDEIVKTVSEMLKLADSLKSRNMTTFSVDINLIGFELREMFAGSCKHYEKRG